MSTFKKTSLGLIIAGLASTTLASPADHCPAELSIADTGIEGMEELSRAFEPFAEAFSEKIGIDVKFYAVSDRTAAATAMRYDEVDLVLAGPSEYAVIASQQDVEVVWGLERDEYGTRFAVHEDSHVQSLEDLKGERVALGSIASTTNHIIPSQMLADAGLDLDRDLDVIMAGDARVRALINGDVEALGGGYRDLDLIERIDPDFEYRVIADSGTMPRDPFIAPKSLGSDCISSLRDAIRAHEEELFEAFVAPADDQSTDEGQERAKYLGARFVFDIEDSEYDIVREAYDTVGLSLD